MPIAPTVSSLPLSLSQLEQYALAASTDERLRVVSHHVDAYTDEWHYLQLLAWQTADIQSFQQPNAGQQPIGTALQHCQSQPYSALLAAYQTKFPHSTQLRTIQLRHDLLTYRGSPPAQQQAVIDKITRDYAHVAFNHTAPAADHSHAAATDEQKQEHPTRLDPALLRLDALLARTFEDGSDLSAFSSSPLAVDAVARHLYAKTKSMSPSSSLAQPRNNVARFLGQLTHPAVPHLLDLILFDLKANTTPFGSRAAHSMLTLPDLEQLSKRLSDIEQQQQYVQARLERMVPDGGLEGLTAEQKTAFYDGQVAYAKTLSDAHIDIKLNTLFHALTFKLQQGIYDDTLFKQYIALPLPHPIVQVKDSSPRSANLSYSRGRYFPPIHHRHNELLTEYVQHFFAQLAASDRLDVDDSLAFDKPFGKRLERRWLREQCAIAQLEANEGLSETATEKFVSWSNPAALNSEKNKVLLSFTPSAFSSNTPPSFMAGEDMQLTMTLKNVGTSMLVKLYRVASTTYYRLQGKEIDVATFNLDGVVAHHEETVTLPSYSPYHRFSHKLPVSSYLPSPSAHGVFIVEVTAQGKKVRALLRRGALTLLSEPTPTGILVKVFDTDMAATARNVRVYVGGHEYNATADGLVLLPYSPQQRHNEPIVLTATDDAGGEYSSLSFITYTSEVYSLAAAVHVDMETLLAGNQSEIVVRATLTLHGRRLPLSQLQRVRLHIQTVHGDGVSSNQVVDDVRLADDSELVHPFTVPPRLRSIHVTLDGEMPRRSVNDVQTVSANTSPITVSTPIEEGRSGQSEEELRESLDDLHMRYGSDGYAVLVLGKAGEAIEHRPVTVELQHRYLAEALRFTLQTDSSGAVLLGELRDIQHIAVGTRTGGKVRTRRWDIATQQQYTVITSAVRARQGETISIAYPSASGLVIPSLSSPAASSVSNVFGLLRLDVESTDLRSVRRVLPPESHVLLMGGYVTVKGLEQGRYVLLMKAVGSGGVQVDILVTPSTAPLLMESFAVYQQRVVQLGSRTADPSIAAVEREKNRLVVQVAHATRTTRLHVTAAHFVPTNPIAIAERIHASALRELSIAAPVNILLSAADMGDESRYILDRRSASKRVGNMLAKPSLLNSELERRGTTFDSEPELRQGQSYKPVEQAKPRVSGAMYGVKSSVDARQSASFAQPAFSSNEVSAPTYGRAMMMKEARGGMGRRGDWATAAEWAVSAPASVEFLGSPSLRVWNVRIGEGGRVELPLDDIPSALSHLDLVLLDDRESGTMSHVRCPLHSLTAHISSAASSTQAEEQKLQCVDTEPATTKLALHPHYSDIRYSPPNTSSSTFLIEQSLVSPLQSGGSLTIADRQSATIAVYDTVDDLYNLLHTLASASSPTIAADLRTFDFVLRWPTLSSAQKLAKYSEFACHELDLFVYQRDRPFFASVVLPFLREKQTPTLFDRVLLGEDVRDWLAQRQWTELNVLEQAMVGRRCGELGDVETAVRVFRSIEQRGLAAQKVSAEEEVRLFDTALNVKALAADKSDLLDDDGDDKEEEQDDGMAEKKRSAKKKLSRKSRAESSSQDESDSVAECGALMDADLEGLNDELVMAISAPAPVARFRAAMPMSAMAPPAAYSSPGGSFGGAAFASSIVDAYGSMGAPPPPPPAPRRIYAEPPTTKEIQERNYWAVTIDHAQHQHKATRVQIGQLWVDYARHMQKAVQQAGGDGKSQPGNAFLPTQLTSSLSSFTDAMAALSLVDLPFSTARKAADLAKQKKSALITAQTPIVVYRKEKQPANKSSEPVITVTTHYFDRLDRYTDAADAADDDEGSGGRRDKYVTVFTPHRTYTCRVVMFNPTPVRRRVRVLQQIPHGAISVGGGQDSRTTTVQLDSVSSRVMEFSFYFPAVGSYLHRAIQISHKQLVVGHSEAVTLPVRHKSALAADLTSWSYLALHGTEQQVIDYLTQPTANWEKLDLSLIAWRWRKRKDFWRQCVTMARERLIFDSTLLACSAHHKDQEVMRLWLPTVDSLVGAVGPFFASPLLRADSEDEWHDGFHYLEYRPLIASRAHQLRQRNDNPSAARGGSGKDTSIVIQNRELKEQYKAFLGHAAFRYARMSDWQDKHKLQLCYYLLLQDRTEEAQATFQSIPQPARAAGGADGQSSGNPPSSNLHYDYMAAFLSMYTEPSLALSIAKRYQQYPINKKRKLFEAIEAQVAEITIKRRDDLDGQHSDGDATATTKPEDADVRDAEMDKLAATEPSLDFALTKDGIELTYANVTEIKVAMYAMDLELLFSTNPFLNSEAASTALASNNSSSSSSSFLYLVPNEQLQLTLPPSPATATSSHTIPLPARYQHSNLLVSVTAGSLRLTKPLYSHGLSVAVIEQFGAVKAVARSDGRPLSRVYVKVYARGGEGGEGQVSFYKDGYTDWRGRFDYASLSTQRLGKVTRFAILLQSDTEGAVVKEAKPPNKS